MSKKQSKNKKVSVEGDLSVQNIAKLKKMLVANLDNTDSLIVDLNNVDNIDPSFLQLLDSTYRTCRESNISLTLTGTDLNILRQSIQQAGFSNHLKAVIPKLPNEVNE